MNSDVQNIASFITILGILFTFWQYFKIKYERQSQIINSLEAQLEVTAIWSGVNGDGYLGEPNEERKLDFSRPFRFVFGIESSAIKNITLQPGIVDFSKEFYKAVAEFNQAISALSDLERFLERLSFNNPEISKIIQTRLNDEENKLEKSTRNHESFMNSFTQNELIAKYVSDKIYNFNYQLHYKFIGSERGEGLNRAHHVLIREINKQKKKNSEDYAIQIFFSRLGLVFLVAAFFCL